MASRIPNAWTVAALLLLPVLLAADPLEPPEHVAHLSGAGSDPTVDRITFTSRARFDPNLEQYLERTPRYLPDWESLIVLPDPPANSSPRTRAELVWLHQLEPRRTDADVAAIRGQIRVAGMKLGPHDMGDVLGESGPPGLKDMLNAAQRDAETIVFRLKRQFDRARPTHLDTGISPCIEVPGHPAYPSGHATQAYLLAYLLSEVDPEHAEAIRRDAAGIARNRELAGVHYPSDSDAGALLARQIVDRLLERKPFVELMEKARASLDPD